MKMTTVFGTVLLAVLITSFASAGTIAFWDYNQGSLSPSIGSGSMAVRGGLPVYPSKWDTDLGDFDFTRTENDSSDPTPITNPGTPLQTRGYRIEWGKAGDGVTGVWSLIDPPGTQALIWKASTTGYNNIHVRMDIRQKSYNPRYFQLQYSLDGTNFVTYPTIFGAALPQEQASWFNHNDIDLSSIPGASNNSRFAFAFIMAYGPGKSFYEPAWVNPRGWPISGQYPRWGFDMVEVYSGTSSIQDTTPPTIKAIYVTKPLPDQPPVSGNIHVQVSATDNAVVKSVTANGNALVRTGLYTWDGNIPGSDGTTVNVVAADEAGRTTNGTRVGYTRTVALNGKHVSTDEYGGLQLAPILTQACYLFPFKAYGTVTKIDTNYFDLTDAAGDPVRIFAPGHNFADGDIASASGVMTQSTAPMPWITSNVALVTKYK